MAEFIIEQDDSFTVVTNTILRDKTLSMSAKGLLSTMLSLPPEWDYSFNGKVINYVMEWKKESMLQ